MANSLQFVIKVKRLRAHSARHVLAEGRLEVDLAYGLSRPYAMSPQRLHII